jgi:hydrogenase expression/formation protein HypE
MSKREGSIYNLDLVVTKWIGMAGTGLIASHKQKDLEQRYTSDYIDRAKAMLDDIGVKGEEIVLRKQPFYALHYLGTGGIYGALWQFSLAHQTGIQVVLEDIPMRQETIEVCEFFDVNPYELDSTGSMMIATDDGAGLVEAMEQAGIPATIIGRTVRGKEKSISRDGELGHLERVVGDAGYKIIKEES